MPNLCFFHPSLQVAVALDLPPAELKTLYKDRALQVEFTSAELAPQKTLVEALHRQTVFVKRAGGGGRH